MEKTNNTTPHSEMSLNANIISFARCSQRQSKKKRVLSILVIDNNPKNQRLFSAILEKAGHIATFVNNDDHALDALEINDYDLIILSSDMPELNGFELLKIHSLISIGKPKIPAIVSGINASQYAINAYFFEAGADAYLTDPFDATQLLQCIDELILSEPSCVV